MLNLSIKSDGTPEGTEVRVGSEVIKGVTAIKWELTHARGEFPLPEVTIRCYANEIDLVVPLDQDLRKVPRT